MRGSTASAYRESNDQEGSDHVGDRQDFLGPERKRLTLAETARFGVPETPSWFVRRARLVTELAGAASKPLLLVSAPAGSGKTSLAADWARSGDPATTGWVTFDDDDEVWGAVLHCLESLGVEVPARESGVVDALDRRPLALLAAAIRRHPERLRLVLDGYEFASAETGRALDFLLRHTEDHLQLVILTRVDPLLPLYRYRLEEKIQEVRASDLSFRDDEAQELMERSGVHLSTDSVHLLNTRIKGWAAGLRFVSRALAVRDDPDRAVAGVVAESGDIGEYLLGEVLEAQKPDVRALLLRTSVPETLYPGLAEELAERPALSPIGILTKINAFVEPVDEGLGCYRYYPFFRDLLRAQLAYESPELMVELQLRTARWLERADLPEASVTQLASIGAWEEAVQLTVGSLTIGRVLAGGPGGPFATALAHARVDTAEGWLVRAALSLGSRDTHSCDEALGQVQASCEPSGCDSATALSLALLRAVRACAADDPHESERLALEAERLLDEFEPRGHVADRPELSALVSMNRGVASLRLGRLPAATELLTAAAHAASAADLAVLEAECLGYLALLDAVAGNLNKAVRAATRSIALTDSAGLRAEGRPAQAYAALAKVALEQFELQAAGEHVRESDTCAHLGDDQVARSLVAEVRSGLLRARGRPTEAVAVAETALAELSGADLWLSDRLRIELVRARLAHGDVQRALGELDALAQPDPAELALATAEVRLGEGDADAVNGALAAADRRGSPLAVRVGSLVLEATRQHPRQDPARAVALLDRSLRMAAAEKMRRPFHEAGQPVHQLLHAAPRLATENSWLTRTLPTHPGPAIARGSAAGSARAHARVPAQRRPDDAGVTPDEPVRPMVETLTPKELEVLGHLADLLSTEEIAATMFVSKNTVRTHVRSILRKLGVTRRNVAVRQAFQLGLLVR